MATFTLAPDALLQGTLQSYAPDVLNDAEALRIKNSIDAGASIKELHVDKFDLTPKGKVIIAQMLAEKEFAFTNSTKDIPKSLQDAKYMGSFLSNEPDKIDLVKTGEFKIPMTPKQAATAAVLDEMLFEYTRPETGHMGSESKMYVGGDHSFHRQEIPLINGDAVTTHTIHEVVQRAELVERYGRISGIYDLEQKDPNKPLTPQEPTMTIGYSTFDVKNEGEYKGYYYFPAVSAASRDVVIAKLKKHGISITDKDKELPRISEGGQTYILFPEELMDKILGLSPAEQKKSAAAAR